MDMNVDILFRINKYHFCKLNTLMSYYKFYSLIYCILHINKIKINYFSNILLKDNCLSKKNQVTNIKENHMISNLQAKAHHNYSNKYCNLYTNLLFHFHKILLDNLLNTCFKTNIFLLRMQYNYQNNFQNIISNLNDINHNFLLNYQENKILKGIKQDMKRFIIVNTKNHYRFCISFITIRCKFYKLNDKDCIYSLQYFRNIFFF